MPNYVANRIDFSDTDEAVFKRICAFMNTEESGENGSLFDFNRLVPMPESLEIECGSSTENGKNLALIVDGNDFDEKQRATCSATSL